MNETSTATEWWVTTGVHTQNGRKVSGPFVTRDDAWAQRDAIEKAQSRTDLWFEEFPASTNG